MSPWIPLVVVSVVPVLAATSRSWFLNVPRSIPVWSALLGAALLSVGAVMKIISGHAGGTALAATPLLQAVAFVSGDRLFWLLTGRVPVSYNEAKWNRRPDGRRWWPDKLFWILNLFGLVVLGAWLCGHFGVEFPTRR